MQSATPPAPAAQQPPAPRVGAKRPADDVKSPPEVEPAPGSVPTGGVVQEKPKPKAARGGASHSKKPTGGSHRTCITLEQKKFIIERSEEAPKLTLVGLADWAFDPNGPVKLKAKVGKSTISGILKDKDRMLKSFEQIGAGGRKKAKIRDGPGTKVGNNLYRWWVEADKNNMVVSDGMLRKEARRCMAELGMEESKNFAASRRWIQKWKGDYSINSEGPKPAKPPEALPDQPAPARQQPPPVVQQAEVVQRPGPPPGEGLK